MPKLGQHFLINKEKIKKIIEVLELKKGDTVIEIGPGHGELTEKLKVKSLKLKVIAVEKDKKLAGAIRNLIEIQKLRNYVEIIEGDALKILLKLTKSYKLKTKSYKIVGNIPYYITGRLLRILSELENKPSLIVLTVQKEVAERLIAQPPKMNLLAASVQFWAKPEIIGYISKKDFRPTPKVDSAIIRLSPTRANADSTQTNAENYYKLIKILFKQPRKTILNNLTMTMTMTMTKDEIIEKLKKIDINPNDRPQNLTIKQIIKLSSTLL